MTHVQHPSERLEPEILRQLSSVALEAEIAGDLHPTQLGLIHAHQWFKIFIPTRHCGLGLSLPEAVRLEESLAWADGSTAWVVTLCAGAGWFVGFVDEAVASEFFTGDQLCIAGSGSATGTAAVLEGEYLINGFWPFATGSLHATAFTANCVIYEDSRPRLNADGTPRVMAFILKREEVTVNKSWDAPGMIATASHSFSVNNVRVGANRSFDIAPSTARLDDAVYRFPFLQLAETTLVANIAGLTVRFLDRAIDNQSKGELSTREVSPNGLSICTRTIRNHVQLVEASRVMFFNCLDEAWQQLLANGFVEKVKLQQMSRISHDLARACRTAVDEIYPLSSMKFRAHESEVNRIWRNVHTALSHALFRTLPTESATSPEL